MKHYRVIGFFVACVLSLGAFTVLTSAKDIELNRDFKIQTVSGDASVLNGVGLEALIKTGKSSFEKVTVTNETVDFKPTKFDTYQYVGEDVLENREVYRNLRFPAVVENEEYLMAVTITSGFPYSTDIPLIHLNIKDKKTGDVSKFESILDVTASEYVYNESLHEYEGTYYYVTIAEGMRSSKSRLLIYTIDPKTGSFNKYHELEASNMWEFSVVNNTVVTKGYSEQDGEKLVVLDLKDKTTQEILMSEQDAMEYIGNFYESNNQLYLESDYQMHAIDLEKLEILPGVNIQPIGKSEENWSWLTDLLVNDNKMYTLYEVQGENVASYQLLVVSDMTTGEVLFEGKMVQRADQGVFGSFELVEVK